MKSNKELKKIARRFVLLEEKRQMGDRAAIKEMELIAEKLTLEEMFLLDDIIREQLTK